MKTYAVGIIGCGNIFPMHAESLSKTPGVRLAAVCDTRRERAREKAHHYQCAYYTDYRTMLKKEPLDCVHICTPHYLHAPMALESAGRGIHALVEKPMAITSRDASKMLTAFKDSKLTLGVISQNRFNPGFQLVKRLADSGDLGSIFSSKLVLSYHKPDAFYRKSDWKGTWDKEGGGVVIDQSIHFLDVLQWIIDSDIDYIEANVANRMHRFIRVEDCAEGVVRFRNGAYVCFYLMNFYSYDADIQIEMHCEKARVKIIKDSAYVEFSDGRKKEARPRPNEYIDYGQGVKSYWGYCHYNQIRDFYDSLRRGKKPAITGLDGKKALDIVLAIYESSKRKKRVYFR